MSNELCISFEDGEGIVFEVNLNGEDITIESLLKAFATVRHLAGIEEDWIDESYDAGFAAGYENALWSAGSEDFTPVPMCSATSAADEEWFDNDFEDIEEGDLVTYVGGATYNDEMPDRSVLGVVVLVDRTGPKVCIMVNFPGWSGGHYGGDDFGLNTPSIWNFWYDQETGECDEGYLKLAV
jgi:hypothetical protein